MWVEGAVRFLGRLVRRLPYVSGKAHDRIRTPADRAIAVINADELYRLRVVRGRDLNDWIPTLDLWVSTGHADDALHLIADIIDATRRLEQYDPREPDPYWFRYAARLHHAQSDHRAEAAVIRSWLFHWPSGRGSATLRARMLSRAERASAGCGRPVR